MHIITYNVISFSKYITLGQFKEVYINKDFLATQLILIKTKGNFRDGISDKLNLKMNYEENVIRIFPVKTILIEEKILEVCS